MMMLMVVQVLTINPIVNGPVGTHDILKRVVYSLIIKASPQKVTLLLDAIFFAKEPEEPAKG